MSFDLEPGLRAALSDATARELSPGERRRRLLESVRPPGDVGHWRARAEAAERARAGLASELRHERARGDHLAAVKKRSVNAITAHYEGVIKGILMGRAHDATGDERRDGLADDTAGGGALLRPGGRGGGGQGDEGALRGTGQADAARQAGGGHPRVRAAWMQEYPKIQSLYKRRPDGGMMFGLWSTPELEWLSGCRWLWTEKVDGTNVRVGWEPFHGNVRLGGRTDRAQIPPKLRAHLEATFTPELLGAAGLSERTTLYGEGYGAGIQKGGGDYGPPAFILFDVVVDGWWLHFEDVRDIAERLGIECVPAVGSGTLTEMEATVRAGIGSALYTTGREPEGLVARTPPGLADRAGRPIYAKIKARDFAR